MSTEASGYHLYFAPNDMTPTIALYQDSGYKKILYIPPVIYNSFENIAGFLNGTPILTPYSLKFCL